ncbi:MAG: amidohydrolase family protein [Candidatus Aminicenantes bacterium]|nr:amidohydrolase family protein [Candidatus Aminicenantes bacterium]
MSRLKMCGVLGLAFIFFVFRSLPAAGQEKTAESLTVLVGATLIDGTGAEPVPNAVIIIEGRKVKAAGPAAQVKVPRGAQRVDVSGKWVLPGFIDCHMHSTYPWSDIQVFTDTDSLATLRALRMLDMYLRSGVTAVRDVGSPVEAMRALVAGRRLGYIDSIRLVPCGDLITVTGGHGDGMRGSMAVDGPWAWRKAVREMEKAGFRHIKISPTFTMEEAQAAVDEAMTLGLRITAHGGGASDSIPTSMTRIAVLAGVQCIEHLNEMTDDVLDLMAERRVLNVPTLAIYRELYRLKRISATLVEKRGWTQQMHEELFRKARERKIVMGIGTDATGEYAKLYPGLYFTEMKYFVELGATPMEAIIAATRNGALVLGMADELGTVEAGKLADLQVLGGDPLKSFDALGKPELVFVDGEVKYRKH